MTTVDCLFDTNAIVKRYHGELGTKIVDYLFKSHKVIISLLTAQVVEVIKTFHKLRSDNEIDDNARDVAVDTFLKDIGSGKIYLYDFSKRHLLDMDIYQPIADYKPRTYTFYDKKSGETKTRTKQRPNTADALMLIIMREIKYINESAGEEAYLVTSDEPVIKVAETLGIKVIDPEKTSIALLPPSLDMREHRRHKAGLRAIFKDTDTSQSLGSTRTVDISEHGIKVRNLQGLTQGRIVNCRLESCKGPQITHDVWGEVRWQSPSHCGLRLAEPIPAEHLETLSR